MPIELSVDLSNRYALVNEPTRVFFKITARAKGEKSETIGRIAPAIVMLIDASGSMRGNKIETAKAAARDILYLLPDGSYINVIAFGLFRQGGIESIGECFELDDRCRSELERSVARLDAEDGTPLYAALTRALDIFRELRARKGKEFPARLYLLTDGIPTDVKDVTMYEDLAKRLYSYGVETVLLGIGDDYNEELLRKIADASLGVVEHISLEQLDHLRHLVKHYTEKAVHTVYRSVRLSISVPPIDAIEVYSGGKVVESSSSSVIVDLGDLAEGDEIRIYGAIIVSPRKAIGRYVIGTISIYSGENVLASRQIELEFIDNVDKLREGSRPEVASEAMAVAGLVRGDIDLVRRTLAMVKDEKLRRTLQLAVDAAGRGDRKTLTSAITKTLRGRVEGG